jgi:hypothetical protein
VTTYTVQIFDFDFNVIKEITKLPKETALEKAEYAFLQGHASRVVDSDGNIFVEFEV